MPLSGRPLHLETPRPTCGGSSPLGKGAVTPGVPPSRPPAREEAFGLQVLPFRCVGATMEFGARGSRPPLGGRPKPRATPVVVYSVAAAKQRRVAHIDTGRSPYYRGGRANRTTINVSLTPEFEKFVEAEVASGRYQSASEVFREGLRLLQDREEKRKAALDEVRKKVRQGLEAAKRGELFDGEEVLREILGESRKRREASAK